MPHQPEVRDVGLLAVGPGLTDLDVLAVPQCWHQGPIEQLRERLRNIP